MGLSLENCELWFERAVFVGVLGMLVLIVIRVSGFFAFNLIFAKFDGDCAQLHFLIALSNYYTYLSNHKSSSLPTHIVWRSRQRSPSPNSSSSDSDSCSSPRSGSSSTHHQHIYLLPRPTSIPKPSPNDIMVYAPVPLHTLSSQQRDDMRRDATEAWISRTEPRHSGHGHRHSVNATTTGRISLPVRDGEGLLPMYEESQSMRQTQTPQKA